MNMGIQKQSQLNFTVSLHNPVSIIIGVSLSNCFDSILCFQSVNYSEIQNWRRKMLSKLDIYIGLIDDNLKHFYEELPVTGFNWTQKGNFPIKRGRYLEKNLFGVKFMVYDVGKDWGREQMR